MDAQQAAELRKPFPRSAIGKLPKGGTQLDYVGHAATTDRLLSVDPEWTWEPVAFGPDGLPAFTTGASKGLWIKLTVCGVTRYGFGDGNSVKECIGDAIRNAAMRFGVALDLWSKEELEQAHGPAAVHATPPAAVAPAPAADPAATDLTDKTRKRLFALFNERGITDRDEQIRGISHIIGRPIASRSELTEADALKVCDVLAAKAVTS
ncbi:MAG TPA: hypothetical protein VFH56_08850 [Acidimicrobiales bacterium]|nr:hypothetical protein [Acidimicrobiales bacterium]